MRHNLLYYHFSSFHFTLHFFTSSLRLFFTFTYTFHFRSHVFSDFASLFLNLATLLDVSITRFTFSSLVACAWIISIAYWFTASTASIFTLLKIMFSTTKWTLPYSITIVLIFLLLLLSDFSDFPPKLSASFCESIELMASVVSWFTNLIRSFIFVLWFLQMFNAAKNVISSPVPSVNQTIRQLGN